jgi:hypothetical protein
LGDPVTVVGKFSVVETKEGTPSGISGLACLPPSQGKRSCLAINDEERFAEWATFDGQALTPSGRKVQLLTQSKKQMDTIVGSIHAIMTCSFQAALTHML